MHRKTSQIVSLFAALTSLSCLPNADAELKHRYSFGSNADDSVGTAHGTLKGNAAVSNGAVALDGSTDTYVELPTGLINGFPAVTIEAWASFGDNGNWSRLFDFGDVNDANQGRNYIFFTPHSGAGDARVVISDADPGFNHEEIVSQGGVLDNQGKLHIAAVFDPANGFEGFYLNGALVASRADATIPLSAVSNVFSYIGKSLYAPDAYLNSSIDEFRIYNSALTGIEIAVSAAAGPDTVNTDPGALQSISLQVDTTMLLNGVQQPNVFGNFANVTNASLTGLTGVTFESSKTTIIAVTTNGQLQAVGLGAATITVSYQGKQASNSITVALAPAVLTHRYSFSEATDATIAKDSVGTADGKLVGGAAFTGNGKLNLDGSDGYVDLPNGIISSMTNATFEAWVTWNGDAASTWQRIFDFGNNSAGEDQQGTGQTYLFLTPRGGSSVVRFAATTSSSGGERPVLNGRAALPVGQQTHVAVVYNASARIATLYVNGLPVASGQATIALKNIKDLNNWLGRSNWPDPFFNGQFDEFRIYEGALSDTEVAFSAGAGPNVLGRDPGALQSLALTVDSTNLVLGGPPVNASAIVNFQNVTNVNVTAFAGTTFDSSDITVVTVSTNGIVETAGSGTATLRASYQGRQATIAVTVTLPPGVSGKAALIHRYSFSDAPGSTTVKDSVGTADGRLVGTGTFSGDGKLNLPGTDGYVDLPNGIISILTNATIEAWVTWKGTRTWERIFDFGSNAGGEDLQGTGQTYLFLSPRGGAAVVRFAITLNSGAGESPVLEGPAALSTTKESHVVVSYNLAAGAARLYVNGQRVAIGAATIPLSGIDDVNVWLGRSNWPDPNFLGQFNEFRIYDGALLDAEVAANFAAGADVLASEVATERLGIARSGNQITISWPVAATGFVLESSSTLGPGASWIAAGGNLVVGNGQNQLTLPILNTGAQYYRLRK